MYFELIPLYYKVFVLLLTTSLFALSLLVQFTSTILTWQFGGRNLFICCLNYQLSNNSILITRKLLKAANFVVKLLTKQQVSLQLTA